MIEPATPEPVWWMPSRLPVLFNVFYFVGGIFVGVDLLREGHPGAALLLAALLVAFALPLHRLSGPWRTNGHQIVGILATALGMAVAILSYSDRAGRTTGLVLSAWALSGMGSSSQFWRPAFLERFWRPVPEPCDPGGTLA